MHWDLLLRGCAERKEKGTQILTTDKYFMKTHFVQQSKRQLRRNFKRNFIICTTGKWIGHLNDEILILVDVYNNKNKKKFKKHLKTNSIIIFKANCYELTTLSNSLVLVASRTSLLFTTA